MGDGEELDTVDRRANSESQKPSHVPSKSLDALTDNLLSARRIIFALLVLVVLGLVAVGVDCGTLWARGFILAIACLAAGFLAGFLFGIPKVLQGDRAQPQDPTSPSVSSNAAYRQRVNTNLEDISDWLTKIIVGLGLYELKRVPMWVGELARAFASSFQQPDQIRSDFGAAIVFFLICGFLLGYLITRLYLQSAMAHADRKAVPEEDAPPSPPKKVDPESLTPDADAPDSKKEADHGSITPEGDNTLENGKNG
ncbi:MAG: hypothetical protein ABSF28_26840 [Terracidiphilus sp.]